MAGILYCFLGFVLAVLLRPAGEGGDGVDAGTRRWAERRRRRQDPGVQVRQGEVFVDAGGLLGGTATTKQNVLCLHHCHYWARRRRRR